MVVAAKQTGNQKGSASNLSSIVAIIVLLAFSALIIYMMLQLKTAETYWTRALYLFGGVEAIAFAAAGYLFGREISREQVKKAEEEKDVAKRDAQQAQQQANAAQQDAAVAGTKIRDIVAAIRAQTTGRALSIGESSALNDSLPTAQAVQAELQQLALIVDEIYHA